MSASRSTLFRSGIVVVAALVMMAGSALASVGALTVTLKSERQSGISAIATFEPRDGMTVVSIAVIGGAGTSFFPDIRSGTCGDAGSAPEIPLALASSAAPTETMIDLPMSKLAAGSRVVMLHATDGDMTSLKPEAALACGEMQPVRPRAPIANAAPATGVGPIGQPSRRSGFLAILMAAAGCLALLARRLSPRGRA